MKQLPDRLAGGDRTKRRRTVASNATGGETGSVSTREEEKVRDKEGRI